MTNSILILQYLSSTVRPCKGKEPEQKVKDNAGKVIGRVPANICKVFKELITSNQVKKITFMSTDNPNRSVTSIPAVFQEKPTYYIILKYLQGSSRGTIHNKNKKKKKGKNYFIDDLVHHVGR